MPPPEYGGEEEGDSSTSPPPPPLWWGLDGCTNGIDDPSYSSPSYPLFPADEEEEEEEMAQDDHAVEEIKDSETESEKESEEEETLPTMDGGPPHIPLSLDNDIEAPFAHEERREEEKESHGGAMAIPPPSLVESSDSSFRDLYSSNTFAMASAAPLIVSPLPYSPFYALPLLPSSTRVPLFTAAPTPPTSFVSPPTTDDFARHSVPEVLSPSALSRLPSPPRASLPVREDIRSPSFSSVSSLTTSSSLGDAEDTRPHRLLRDRHGERCGGSAPLPVAPTHSRVFSVPLSQQTPRAMGETMGVEWSASEPSSMAWRESDEERTSEESRSESRDGPKEKTEEEEEEEMEQERAPTEGGEMGSGRGTPVAPQMDPLEEADRSVDEEDPGEPADTHDRRTVFMASADLPLEQTDKVEDTPTRARHSVLSLLKAAKEGGETPRTRSEEEDANGRTSTMDLSNPTMDHHRQAEEEANVPTETGLLSTPSSPLQDEPKDGKDGAMTEAPLSVSSSVGASSLLGCGPSLEVECLPALPPRHTAGEVVSTTNTFHDHDEGNEEHHHNAVPQEAALSPTVMHSNENPKTDGKEGEGKGHFFPPTEFPGTGASSGARPYSPCPCGHVCHGGHCCCHCHFFGPTPSNGRRQETAENATDTTRWWEHFLHHEDVLIRVLVSQCQSLLAESQRTSARLQHTTALLNVYQKHVKVLEEKVVELDKENAALVHAAVKNNDIQLPSSGVEEFG